MTTNAGGARPRVPLVSIDHDRPLASALTELAALSSPQPKPGGRPAIVAIAVDPWHVHECDTCATSMFRVTEAAADADLRYQVIHTGEGPADLGDDVGAPALQTQATAHRDSATTLSAPSLTALTPGRRGPTGTPRWRVRLARRLLGRGPATEVIDGSAVDTGLDPVRSGAFGHGYLIRPAGPSEAAIPPAATSWPTRRVGSTTYHLHPRTRCSIATEGRWGVVLLGHPVDVDRASGDTGAIATAVLRTLREEGHAAATRQVAYLGGRWTAVLQVPEAESERLIVLPDTHGTQPVYYGTVGGLAVGSAMSLVADALGQGPDEESAEVLQRARQLRARGVIYYPGLLTSHRNVLPVVPNCLLDIRLTRAVRGQRASVAVDHRRFWPFEARREQSDIGAVAEAFSERMSAHIGLLSGFGRVGLSLTAGLDSRITLAMARPYLRRDDFTFTYLNPRPAPSGGAYDDVFGASAIAARVKLPYRLIRWRSPEPDSIFDQIYRTTYPVQRGSPGAAHAMGADLTHDMIQLQSVGGETGTVFPRLRNAEPISPRKLSRLWLGMRPGDHRRFFDYFEAYIAYSQFSQDRLRGYNHHDVNYWEHRMGKWGCRKAQDGDFSHRLLMPYNDRRLIELMLSLPPARRADKSLYRRILQEHPQLQMPWDKQRGG